MSEWRIVPELLWQGAHARLAAARKNYLRGTHEQPWGRPTSGTAAKYLLTGLARCGVCGGGLTVRSRAHGKAPRSFRYLCATHHYRGRAVCANGLEMRLETADEAVLDLIEGDILRPTVIEPAVRMALDALLADQPEDRRADLTRRLRSVEAKVAH